MTKPSTANKKSSSSKSILTPLQKTKSALKEIDRALQPHLRLLKRLRLGQIRSDGIEIEYDDSHRMKQLAEARLAVSLAMGTIRYIGNRLRGCDEGKKKGDPLRTELDRMRAMLVTLRKLESSADAAVDKSSKNAENKKSTATNEADNKTEKKSEGGEGSAKGKQEVGKSKLDVGAAKRMVKAALARDNTIDKSSDEKPKKVASLERSSPKGGKRAKADSSSVPNKKKRKMNR